MVVERKHGYGGIGETVPKMRGIMVKSFGLGNS